MTHIVTPVDFDPVNKKYKTNTGLDYVYTHTDEDGNFRGYISRKVATWENEKGEIITRFYAGDLPKDFYLVEVES